MKIKLKRHPKYKAYFVSKCGDVFSTLTGAYLTPYITKRGRNGYRRIVVRYKNKSKNKKICQMVLETYCGKRPSKDHVCAHLDGNSTNDKISNLAWVTYKENSDHMELHGTRLCGSKHPRAKLSDDDVRYIKKHYVRQSRRASNASELAKKFGVSKVTITTIVYGKAWRHLYETKNETE